MRSIIAFLVLGTLAGFTACKTTGKTMKKSAQVKNAIPVIRKTDYAKPDVNGTAADFHIQDLSVEGDIATVIVNYSGGCNEHKFNAYFNGAYMKSLPPKATVFIEHDNGGDNCRKLVVDTLYFDLTAVRYSPDKEGTVIVGFNGGDKTIEYKYK